MGNNVLITGSRRGIGKTMVESFAREGLNVFAHARQPNVEFESYLKELSEAYSVHIRPIYFDMTDIENMKKTIKELYKEDIRLDVLVNNAGIAHGGLFQMTSVDTIRQVFDINLFSQMSLTQLVLRGMQRNKSGCIINMASISGIDLQAGNSAYGVSKAGIIAWTKTLAAEMGEYGIRVNAIAPGLTDTDMSRQMESKAGAAMKEQSVMKRLATPQEVANVAVFLASDRASFVNGQTIRVDGGS